MMVVPRIKKITLSLALAICAGQRLDAISLPVLRDIGEVVLDLGSIGFGTVSAVKGFGGFKNNAWRKRKVVGGFLGTAVASCVLSRQAPELPGMVFGFVGGAYHFLTAQNYKQYLGYGLSAAACGLANPKMRAKVQDVVSQHPKLAAGFVGAVILGKLAHVEKQRREAAAKARTKERKEREAAAERKTAAIKIASDLSDQLPKFNAGDTIFERQTAIVARAAIQAKTVEELIAEEQTKREAIKSEVDRERYDLDTKFLSSLPNSLERQEQARKATVGSAGYH